MDTTSTVARRRTRSQWEQYYVNCCKEMNRKNEESAKNIKRGRSAINSETISVDGKSEKSYLNQYFSINDENRVGRESIIEGSESSEERTRNGVKKCAENENAREGEKKDYSTNLSKTLGVKGNRDDEIEDLGEEDGANNSSFKLGPESRTESRSKVSKMDQISDDKGRKGGVLGRGSHHLEEREESDRNSDGSDRNSGDSISESESESESEPESTSEEDNDDPSDLDYDEDESSVSAGLDVSCSSDDFEDEKDNEDGDDNSSEKEGSFNDNKRMRKDGERESDEGDDKGSSCVRRSYCMQGQEENVVVIDENEKLPSFRKSPRISVKKERDLEQEGFDDKRNDHKKEEVVIVIEDDEKLPSIRRSARFHRMKDSEFSEIYEQHSSSGSMDEANQDVSKKVNDDCRDFGSKKRKICGLMIVVDCEKSENKECLSEAKNLWSKSKEEEEHGLGTRSCPVLITDRGDDFNTMGLKKKKARGVETRVDCEGTKHYSISKSRKGEHEQGKRSSPIMIPDNDKSAPSKDEESGSSVGEEDLDGEGRGSNMNHGKEKTGGTRNHDLIEILVDFIAALREGRSPIIENAPVEETLPLRFRFEDEVEPPPPEKSEWDEEIDSLFKDLELGLRESETDGDNLSTAENDDTIPTEIDKSPAACCRRGEHQPILDEEIGVKCLYCSTVILEIKYVLPPFYTPPLRRQDRKELDEPPPPSIIDQIHFPQSNGETFDRAARTKGMVWDLIAGVPNDFYNHQCKAFEFMWKNIAGGTDISKLKEGPLSDRGKGCIISHAPGTGKTRLTLVFLQSFLKLYPTSCPVIVAPKGMLLNWEAEFVKWRVDVPFHNLNKNELSGKEDGIPGNLIARFGRGKMRRDCIRLVKLYSWMKGGSVLGISYKLFEQLAGEKGQYVQIRKVLLEVPTLLVLDEGHTPRNDQSRIWKALKEVITRRCIILSGTPFQNNCTELLNTLSLVDPEFRWETRKKWKYSTSSMCKSKNDEVKELKFLLKPFVDVYEGNILQESLPGLIDTIVILHPTAMQETLLKIATREANILRRIHHVSLVAVHPSMVAEKKRFALHKSKLEEIESDIDEGVKLKFIMRLIWLADALGERVLVFSQFKNPLFFIKEQLKTHFSWEEGTEVLHMDGDLDVKNRQKSISALNDNSSKVKVLLASEKACCEGISLIGASRVVLLDTVWNPSVERQAISRAYRIGQKKLVYVYRLIISGTEARQYELQSKKDRLSEMIFSPVDGCKNETSDNFVSEDKVLQSICCQKGFDSVIAKVIYQPKECDLMETFGFVDL